MFRRYGILILVVGLLSIAGFWVITTQRESQDRIIDWQTYENNRYSIDYPKGWEVMQDGGGVMLDIIGFRDPDENSDLYFLADSTEGFTIFLAENSAEKVGTTSQLNSFLEIVKTRMNKNPDYKILTISGRQAIQTSGDGVINTFIVDYKHLIPNIYDQEQLWGYGYSIYTLQEFRPEFLQIYNKMVESFHINDKR